MHRDENVIRIFGCVLAAFFWVAQGHAQAPPPKPAPAQPNGAASAPPKTPTPGGTKPSDAGKDAVPPPDYIIGPDDVLTVRVWGQTELSGDFTVRPDGKITLPLVNEVQAGGLTPEQLRHSLTAAVSKFYDEPTVTVNTNKINSRKVFITGNVARPGEYPLLEPTTVVMLITKAGGLAEYADKKNIVILGRELRPDGTPVSWKFNYEDVSNLKNLKQNRELRPGDQVIVR
jgi:polysaccharide export outer membrane protein